MVSVLSADEVVATCTLSWHNDIEQAVLMMAVAVLALDLGADAVEARRSGDDGVALVTGRACCGPATLTELLAPLRDLLPPNAGFRPLAVEVAAARRNLAAAAPSPGT